MAVPTLTTVTSRPVVAGEPWLVSAAGEVADEVADGLPVLQWQLAPAPFTVAVRMVVDSQPTKDNQIRQLTGPGRHQQTYRGVSWSLTGSGADIRVAEAGAARGAVRRILHHRAIARGLVPLHAAAVGLANRFWVIPAAGGTGKSTATAIAAATGLEVLGDDLVLWDPATDRLWSVSRFAALTGPSLSLVAEVAPPLQPGRVRSDGKHRVSLAGAQAQGELAGLLLLTDDTPTPALAWRHLASTLVQTQQTGAPMAPLARPLRRLATTATLRSAPRRSRPDLLAGLLWAICDD